MAKQRIDAIIIQKIATLTEWNNIGRVPEKGEFMLIQNSVSQPVNLKIGDGNRAFSALPNFIQYDQAAYVAPVGNVLPVPPNNVGYSLLTEGSYNSGVLVVPTGNIGKAEYIGNAWVLTNMPLPTANGVIVPASQKTTWINNEGARLQDRTLVVSNKPTHETPIVGSPDWDLVGGDVFADNLFDFSKNLIDANSSGVAIGQNLNTTGGLTPGAFNTTDFIRIFGGQTYTASNRPRFIAYYNANKVFISFTDLSGSPESFNVLSTPSNAAYIRISYSTTNWGLAQLEIGSSATSYVVGGKKIKQPLMPLANLGDNTVSTSKIQDNAVTPLKASFIVVSKNLFDKTAILPESGMSQYGTITPNPTLAVSDFIPVVQGRTYIGSRNTGTPIRFLTYFNANRQVVAGGSDASLTQFTVPSNTGIAFARATVYTAALDDTMIRDSAQPAGYVDFGSYISSDIKGFQNQSTPLRVTYQGDSITIQNRWQPVVNRALNLIPTNIGIAGTRVSGTNANAMWQDVRVNAIPTDSEVIVLTGGTNDWAQSAVLGAIDSSDTDTFYGAYNVMLQKIIARCPTAKIFLGLTPIGRRTAPLPAGWTDPFVNAIGLRTQDYAKAVQEIAFKYGLPTINFNSLGWNQYNIDSFVPDGLHPQGIGADQMSKEAIHSMSSRLRVPN